MWASERIEKLVPYLRRYARAATGDTKIGDACVERTLQNVLELSLQPDFEFDRYDRESSPSLLPFSKGLSPDPPLILRLYITTRHKTSLYRFTR